MTAKAEILVAWLAVTLLVTAARAAELPRAGSSSEEFSPAARPPAESLPDAGFLEFLGLLIEDGDGYLDPLDMAVDETTEADHEAEAEGRPGSDPGAVEDEDEPRN
ncbi:hypothetical protein [Wenzhouxiangella sp. XN24]|uniref:hypothetical protein n=1 Tax=Wenzhouxiangella sp. XN24 TaxID=2713569 RepID=UPI0013EBC616|nr:hypothetical protein [Wenzhouxiangella sp. XN24]NGX16297.1 hypothetical protein [Wenzhouxiangella sp. XN24]